MTDTRIFPKFRNARTAVAVFITVLMTLVSWMPFIESAAAASDENQNADTDGDGLYDHNEDVLGTNPSNGDSDSDGLNDAYECGIFRNVSSGFNEFKRDPLVINYWNTSQAWQGTPASPWPELGTFLGSTAHNPRGDKSFYASLDEWNRDSDGDGLSDGYEVSMRIATNMPVWYDQSNPNNYARGDWLLFDPTNPDTDGDGIGDTMELSLGLSKFNLKRQGAYLDFDGDELSDFKEIYVHRTNPFNPDTDGDGLPDPREVYFRMDPLDPDMDDDGLVDGKESADLMKDGDLYSLQQLNFTFINHSRAEKPVMWMVYQQNPFRNFDEDHDGDGLTDKEEMLGKLGDPDRKDSDNDGLTDAEESQFGSDPFNPDTDNDSLGDNPERTWVTDPIEKDTDDDGLLDGEEVYGFEIGVWMDWYPVTDPNSPDMDGDGLTDFEEVRLYGSNPYELDSDGDGLSDEFEVKTSHTAVGAADPDCDGLSDAVELARGTNASRADPDNDNLTDAQELQLGSDPNKPDADNDLFWDDSEIQYGSDPFVADKDGDNLNDPAEQGLSTDPNNADTDGDGYNDDIDMRPCMYCTTIKESWQVGPNRYYTPSTPIYNIIIDGPYAITADGNQAGVFRATLRGRDYAQTPVTVSADKPLGMLTTGSDKTDIAGQWSFTYKPNALVGEDQMVTFTISGAGVTVQVSVTLSAKDVVVEVLRSPVICKVGFATKFKVKVTDDYGQPLDNVDVGFVQSKCPGTITFNRLNSTHFEGTWRPSKDGTFILEVVATYKTARDIHIVTAISGPNPLDRQIAQVTKYFPELRNYSDETVEYLQSKMDWFRDIYFLGSDDEKMAILNQTTIIAHTTYALLETERALLRLANDTADLLMPTLSIDFALGFFTKKVGAFLGKFPRVQQLLDKVKEMYGLLMIEIWERTGKNPLVEEAIIRITTNLTEKIPEWTSTTSAAMIKGNLDEKLNAYAKSTIATAMLTYVSKDIINQFESEIGRISTDSKVDPGKWTKAAEERVIRVLQLSRESVISGGLVNTIMETTGPTAEASKTIAAGLEMSVVGASLAIGFEVLGTFLSTIATLAKVVGGVQYAVAFQKLIGLGTTPLGRSVPPPITMPSSLDPLPGARSCAAQLSDLGNAAYPGSATDFNGKLDSYIAAQSVSASTLSGAMGWINVQMRQGKVSSSEAVYLLDGCLELALAELGAAVALMNASVNWENETARSSVRCQARSFNYTLYSTPQLAENVTSVQEPASAFLPVIDSMEYPQKPVAAGSSYEIAVKLKNLGNVAGNVTVALVQGQTRTVQDTVIGALDTAVVRFTQLTAAGGSNELTVELVNRSVIRVLFIEGYSSLLDPVIGEQNPKDGQNLSEAPSEITFVLTDGTGDRSIVSGAIRLDNVTVGNITFPGKQAVRLDTGKIANGTHLVSVSLTSASRNYLFNWSFILRYPTPPPVNNTNNTGTNNTGNNTNTTNPPANPPILLYLAVGAVVLIVAVSAVVVVLARRGKKDSGL